MRDNYNYDSIFHSYTKYRPATFNNILAYDNSIFKLVALLDKQDTNKQFNIQIKDN